MTINVLSLFQILIEFDSFADIDDPTGQIADDLTKKYLGSAEMGNFTSMTPGLTDVSKLFSPFYCRNLKKLIRVFL